jgi:hypothetical protein
VLRRPYPFVVFRQDSASRVPRRRLARGGLRSFETDRCSPFHFQDCHLRQLEWMHSGAIFGQFGMTHAGGPYRRLFMRKRVKSWSGSDAREFDRHRRHWALLTILGFNLTQGEDHVSE